MCQALGHRDNHKFSLFLVNRLAKVSVLYQGDKTHKELPLM